ncbi:MAG TPA: hypothetical protein VGL09_09105 [Methylomirabilota bacterium]
MLTTGCATSPSRVVTAPRTQDITAALGVADLTDAYLIGGDGNDWVRDILCDGDGCALFGFTMGGAGSSMDFLAVAEALDGTMRWAKTYGGMHRNMLRTAVRTEDGGYLLVGTSESRFTASLKPMPPSRPPRPLILKIDGGGQPSWAETLDPGGVHELYRGVAVTGGHVFVGYADIADVPRLAAVKISDAGQIVWAHAYVTETPAWGVDVVARENGEIVVAGSTGSRDGKEAVDAIVLTLGANGAVRRARQYHSAAAKLEVVPIVAGKGRELILAGAARGQSGQHVFAMKLGTEGKPVWSRRYAWPKAAVVSRAVRGHYRDVVIVGRMADAGAPADAVAMLLDEAGNVKASTMITGSRNDEFRTAIPWADGRYRLVGDTESFGTGRFDFLSAMWTPNGHAGISASDLRVTTTEVRARAVPLGRAATRIEPSLLEVKTLGNAP